MTTARPDHWRRYSLRSLFVLMTVICVLFGAWAAYVRPFRQQQVSLAVVNRLQGNTAKAPANGPAWQRWLVTTLLGDDAFEQVVEVDLDEKKVDDETLHSLTGLIHLRELSLNYTPITDDGVRALRAMPKLRNLSLRYTDISDRGAAQVAALPDLRTAYLTGTEVTDEGVAALSKLGTADELYIRWTRITDAGAARLMTALPNCAVYHHALAP